MDKTCPALQTPSIVNHKATPAQRIIQAGVALISHRINRIKNVSDDFKYFTGVEEFSDLEGFLDKE
jgi:hypothetical protein